MTDVGKVPRKLKRGQEPAPEELDKVKALILAMPGLSGEELKRLIVKEVGLDLAVGTIYRWLNQWGLPTARQIKKHVPVVFEAERESLARLLGYLVVPDPSGARAFFRLVPGGPHELKLKSGLLRLYAGPEFKITRCWLTAEEFAFLDDVLRRADRQRGSELSGRFQTLHSETVQYLNHAAALERSMQADPEWKVIVGKKTVTPRQTAGTELQRSAIALRLRVQELVSSVRLAAGL
jgi:hypothetical protein